MFDTSAAVTAAADVKQPTSRSPEKRFSKRSSKRSPNKKRSSYSSNSYNNSSSTSSKPSPTSGGGTPNRSSPADLNELLQRTKELVADDCVSSSPIYGSKSDYKKSETYSSRKSKRVSPIQFELTDDETDESSGEYNHHRDREHHE